MDREIKKLYESFSRDIYRYLLSLTRDATVAEDITSDVFISAIVSLPRFEGKSDIKTWLFSIARHKWYEHLRKTKKQTTAAHLLEMYVSEGKNEVEQSVDNTLTVERVTELLGSEKEQTRDIVLMRAEGYSFYDIAKKHGISESSARVIDFRARKKIREILIKEGFVYE